MTSEEILQIFFVECEEALGAAEAGLAACQTGTQDDDTVNAIFRAVHSIKGGAGAFGFSELQAYTHTFETLLADVREGTVTLGTSLVALLLRALDTLSDHVNAIRESTEPPSDAALLAELTAAQADSVSVTALPTSEARDEPEAAEEPSSESEEEINADLDSMLDDIFGEFASSEKSSTWLAHITPHADSMRNGSEPLLMLREVANLGGECVTCDFTQLPQIDCLEVEQGYLGWTFAMPSSVSEESFRDIFDFVADGCSIAIGEEAGIPPVRIDAAPRRKPVEIVLPVGTPILAADVIQPASTPKADVADSQPPPAPPSLSQSIRIDLVKLDRLIDSVGELVIAQAMLAQRLSGEGLAATEELALLEGLTRDIQESAMSVRAQPIGSVFSRVPRILRELAASTHKHVRLEVFGETTELDKTLIERLGEPLTHLIRNAVDHGIETAEERIAAGKTAEGTLTLSAEQRSGRILIRISDDGRGINRERVLAKALEKGLIQPDTQLSKDEIDQLIFAPGFSTAASVTNVSGRGVGMDVVRQNVKELGGRITIESEEGKGTSFTLALPLTLAISDGMIVNVGDQTLVVPLAHIVESLRPKAGDVQGLGSQRKMLNVRGRFIPVISLHEAIDAGGVAPAPEEGVLIVVDTESAGQAALLVNNISDQRQFVIKSLDAHYRAVEGVAGATILGDGRVALILDVDGLVANSITAPERRAA